MVKKKKNNNLKTNAAPSTSEKMMHLWSSPMMKYSGLRMKETKL